MHPKTDELLTLVNHSGTRLLNLVNDILDSARMREQHTLVLSEAPVDLVAVLRESLQINSVMVSGVKQVRATPLS